MVSIKALGVFTLEDLWRECRWVHEPHDVVSKLPARARAGKDTSQRGLRRAFDVTLGSYWTTRVPFITAGWMSQRKK
jgi:hypothetical protein